MYEPTNRNTNTVSCRWSEVTRHLQLWVQLMELNEAGQFTAVEVLPAKDVRTGGVFQLKQVIGELALFLHVKIIYISGF